ncbi:MAG: hypothetical protein H6737_10390 [Alphaproteobacteria bacterium]|nr:hypothetical protein [Alphaproteobacteria bacterium]
MKRTFALVSLSFLAFGCPTKDETGDTDTDTTDTDTDDPMTGWTVTLTGTGYDPHDGNDYEAVLHDTSGVVAYASGTQSGGTMNITFSDVPDGTYDVYWYFDLDGSGDCVANEPSWDDHVWADTVTVGMADATVTHNHDANWVDHCADIHAPM